MRKASAVAAGKKHRAGIRWLAAVTRPLRKCPASNLQNEEHGDHEVHGQALNAKAIDAITSNGSFNHFKVPNLLILGVSIWILS